ncbi:MAG TPA: S9 family peptidase, partial [Pseudoduganella sp.]
MHRKRATLATLAGITAALLAGTASQALAQACAAGSPLTYPVTQKVDQRDDYHGTMIADPYRWLEDANSAETKAWVIEQNKLTQGFLGRIPERAAIRQRLTQLWNFERYSVPFKEGGRYFYSRNDGLQNQAVLYTLKTPDDQPRVLLDPNTLAADGTVALAGLAISPQGKHLAYSTAASGSDWNEIRVRDIDTGKDTSDHIKWVKFSSTAWAHDGAGFYYSRYDAPAESARLAGINYF